MSSPVHTSESIRLGRGYSVEFRLDAERMDAIWSPRVPTGRRGRQLLPAYRKARDEFLERVAGELGTNITCVEAP